MNGINAPVKLRPPVPNAQTVGWLHLADALGLNAPVERPCTVLDRRLSGGVRRQAVWRLYERRCRPGDYWLHHLRFAVRHEGLHPLLLVRTLAKGAVSVRYRVRDNLLGTATLCPFVQKRPALSLRDGGTIRECLRRLKVFRLEAIRAGFWCAWQANDYATIVEVAAKIPENVLQEDPKLLMWYDWRPYGNQADREGRGDSAPGWSPRR